MKKQPWDLCKLTVVDGFMPEPGDVLGFAGGRRYQVLKVGGKKTLHCLLLPPDHDVGDARVLAWAWAPRARKARR